MYGQTPPPPPPPLPVQMERMSYDELTEATNICGLNTPIEEVTEEGLTPERLLRRKLGENYVTMELDGIMRYAPGDGRTNVFGLFNAEWGAENVGCTVNSFRSSMVELVLQFMPGIDPEENLVIRLLNMYIKRYSGDDELRNISIYYIIDVEDQRLEQYAFINDKCYKLDASGFMKYNDFGSRGLQLMAQLFG